MLQQLFTFSSSAATAATDVDSPSWISDYNCEIAEACKRVLPSAEAAFITYQILRKADVKPQANNKSSSDLDGVSFQPPGIGGHTDVSAEGYLHQLRASIPETHPLGKPGPGKKRRVVFLKFWRNVSKTSIMNHHLAVLDKSSLKDADIFEAELDFKGYKYKQNRMVSNIDVDGLNWIYFPQMERDELLCFQQGDLTMHGSSDDSVSPRVTFPPCRQDHATFHGAFEDPTAAANVPPRQSIEVAAFVFLPEEPEVLSKL